MHSNQYFRILLKILFIKIPRQIDPGLYSIRLFEVIPKSQIIRWYIARFDENNNAVIEVVYINEKKKEI